MIIQSLEIKNFRCFKEIKATFEKNLTVFVAKNGQGKSSILDAIKIALWPYVSGFDLGKQTNLSTGIEVSDVFRLKADAGNMEPVLPSAINARLCLDGEKISDNRYRDSIDSRTKTKDGQGTSVLKKKAIALQKKIFSEDLDKNIQLPIVAYYGTGRLWNMRRLFSEEKDENSLSRTYGYRGCLDSSSTFKYFAEWYIQIFKSYRDAQIIALEKNINNSDEVTKRFIPIKVIQSTINTIIKNHTGWKDIRYSTQENTLTLGHSTLGELSVDQLSDGIRNIFAVVADIAYRCLLLNPALGEEAALKTSGIVLIDEVDMHLHPAWQQTILEDLQLAFPAIQFIVTTHSPQVISAISSRNIRILDEGHIYTAPYGTEGAESSRILKQIFNVDSRPQQNEYTQALMRYQSLAYADQWDNQEAKELRKKLNEKYRGAEPLLKEIDLHIENRKWELGYESN